MSRYTLYYSLFCGTANMTNENKMIGFFSFLAMVPHLAANLYSLFAVTCKNTDIKTTTFFISQIIVYFFWIIFLLSLSLILARARIEKDIAIKVFLLFLLCAQYPLIYLVLKIAMMFCDK